MANERIQKKRKRGFRATVSVIIKAAAGIFLAAALVLHLNDRYFHIAAIPSAYDVIRFFGGGAKPYADLSEGEIAVSFIDVGQGDCELITANGCNILIDSGDIDRIAKTEGFLRYSGVERLDLVIVTHPHDDHFGAMYRILRDFEVGAVVMPELETNGRAYEQLRAETEKRNIPLRYAAAGESMRLGEDMYLDIIAPLFLDYEDENDFSIVARLVYGETSFLFTGDLAREGELDLLEAGTALNADVLKVGHHGSAGSSSEEFLSAVKPKIAVFETGRINYYGHPRTEVLERLAAVGCSKAYSTANNGNIVIVSNGKELRVLTEREEEYAFGNTD